MQKKINIGVCISEAKYQNYPTWIMQGGNNFAVVELSFEKQNAQDLANCHALLLTGGIDIDPIFYRPDNIEYPHQPKQFNPQRDAFEMSLLKAALKKGMPVLGICRGLQLINTTLGGTLLQDIESSGKPNHRNRNGIDHIHEITIVPHSALAAITGCYNGMVNSSHHQSVLATAPELMVSSYAHDGIIESLEWKDPSLHLSSMICVQWHPERMDEKNSHPLSQQILNWFLSEAEKYYL
jgi:putative glutamine amidotransferase